MSKMDDRKTWWNVLFK